MIHKLCYIFTLIVAISLSGCDICFAPGAGYNTSSTEIDVPVKVPNANPNQPSSLWVDSGETVNINEEVPMVISGTVNFCEDEIGGEDDCDKSPNCRKVLVPYMFCSDGNPPKYDRDPITGRIRHSIEPKDLCPNGFIPNGKYVDSGLKVSPGDKVTFKLIPAISITINNCETLPDGVSTFEGCNGDGTCINPNDCVIGLDDKCIDPVKLCKDGATVKIRGAVRSVDPFLGKTYTSIIDNDFSPYSNRLAYADLSGYNYGYLSLDTSTSTPNVNAALIDLRESLSYNRAEYDYGCSLALSTDGKNLAVVTSPELHKFSLYNVLYRCNFINKYMWLMGPGKIALRLQSTILYDWEPNGPNGNLQKNRKLKIQDFASKSWAFNSEAKICDEHGNCNLIHKHPGIELNNPYKIGNVKPKSKLMLHSGLDRGKNGNFFGGGYNFEVRKSCIKENGNGLYMYIGASPPTIKPGDNGTYNLERTLETSDGITTTPQFVVNKDNPPENGKIYFGIKGAEDSDTFKKKKTSPENKYTATIIRPKFAPKFSEPFNLLIKTITNILYGDGINDKGIIRTMYEGITGPSNFNAIQAVLVLYIALYGVMFAMGLIEHLQVDLATRIIKVGFIMLLFSRQSWDFFGYTLHSFFIKGSKALIGAFSGVLDTNNNSFEFFDLTFGTLLTSETWLRFLSLIFSGPAGFLVFFLVIWGVCLFAMAFIEAIISYIMAIIALGIMLVLAPIFITFILFQRTRPLFDGWIKLLINFSLKPVFLFSGLAFLNQILLSTFYAINNFGVCTRNCWLYIVLFGEGERSEGLCFLDAILPMGFSQTDNIDDRIKQSTQDIEGMGFMGLPFTISSVIIFLVVANLMKVFSGISESIVQAITGSMSSMMEVNRSASQALLSLFGKDDATKQAIAYADNSQNKGKQRANFKAVHDEEGKASNAKSSLDNNKSGTKAEEPTKTRSAPYTTADPLTAEKHILDSKTDTNKSINTTSNISNAADFINTSGSSKAESSKDESIIKSDTLGHLSKEVDTDKNSSNPRSTLENNSLQHSPDQSKILQTNQEENKEDKSSDTNTKTVKPGENTISRNNITPPGGNSESNIDNNELDNDKQKNNKSET